MKLDTIDSLKNMPCTKWEVKMKGVKNKNAEHKSGVYDASNMAFN
ncbi:conserved hypothetical protein [Vibrio chagasii]|nr:conserved hypothetical protein [Vibrio chagasii]CAH6822816.1 conserved hypothetical protein [Vibrio chagasii]CAH6825740.1 conserved hypothetical protein [Vibrio chagasii]CAH6826439.1 conserved hypothetical protein [Vibrio chagasii]CAH6827819.1 conserved hypothetical protein [Vibrio chagasii]